MNMSSERKICLACCRLWAEAKSDPEKFRFQVELEFVQCLANPQYLKCT